MSWNHRRALLDGASTLRKLDQAGSASGAEDRHDLCFDSSKWRLNSLRFLRSCKVISSNALEAHGSNNVLQQIPF